MCLEALVSSVVTLALVFGCAPPLDIETQPHAYVVTGGDYGQVYFKMVPGSRRAGTVSKGRAYRVSAGEQDELLWSVSGWYAHTTFISRDGRYLVRLGNWPVGSEPEADDLAVAFYDNGVLLESYSTRDLIKNDELVPTSEAHYFYLLAGAETGFVSRSRVYGAERSWFELVTVDGIRYTFDRRTGEVVSSEAGVGLPESR